MTTLTRICCLLAATALLLTAVPLAGAESSTAPAPTSTTSSEETSAPDDGDQSASERRAAASDFERKKLDSEAFAADDAASSDSKKESGGSGGGGSIARGILGFVVVLGSIFGVHWLLKRWGASRMQGVAGRAGIIDVVATTSLAQGRSLHLVRVGDEMVLVGATENSITRIGEVDVAQISSAAGNAGKGEFQAMLNGAMYGQQPGVPAGMGGAGATKEPFVKRFIDNLRLTTAR